MSLPNVGQAAVNDDGHFTVPWRKWLAGVERTIAAGGTNATALASDIASIATALGSPDGTVANIPDQSALNVRFDGQNGIAIEGSVAGGRVSVIWRGVMANLSDVDLTGLADTNVLKWDAASSTWKPATASGVTDGDKGDVVVSSSGTAWTIDTDAVTTSKVANNAVTYAKLQDVSTTARVLGRKTAGSGDPEECSLSDVLDFIGSAAQGDILYRGASAWTRLPAGISGQVLTTGGAGANPSWAAASGGGSGGMTLVGTATVSGAAATNLTLSGLDLGTDGCYYILWAVRNASASAVNLSLFYNSDTTATNYWTQYAYAVTGTINSPSKVNTAVVDAITAGANRTSTGDVTILKDIDGRARSHFRFSRDVATSPQVIGGTHVWTTLSNVTSITVNSSVANALDVGSYIKVFKVK